MSITKLSKSDKLQCRKLIHKGIELECRQFINDVQKQLAQTPPDQDAIETYREQDGHPVSGPWHDQYIKLFKEIMNFDRHIGRRYDGITGSHYLEPVIELYAHNILSDTDIAAFSDEVRDYIISFRN